MAAAADLSRIMTLATPLLAIGSGFSAFLSELVTFYQRRISPHKGFCCAYRAKSGRCSCSQHAKRLLARVNVLKFVPLLLRRFRKCKSAAEALREGKARRARRISRAAGFAMAIAGFAGTADGRGRLDGAGDSAAVHTRVLDDRTAEARPEKKKQERTCHCEVSPTDVCAHVPDSCDVILGAVDCVPACDCSF